MKKILIGVATRGNDIYYKLCGWLLNQKDSKAEHIDVLFAVCHTGAAFAQNLIFEQLVAQPYDYLFLVDSDLHPPDDIIDKLISHDKDIIKAPVWHYDPISLEIHADITKKEDMIRRYNCPTGGVEKIFTSSFSCLMIKRRVLERFIQKGETFTLWSPLIHPQFKASQSDSIFFAKTRAFGFDAWVDWSLRDVVHHKIVDLGGPVLDKYFINRAKQLEGVLE